MQRTADFHHHIANTFLNQADGVFDHATAFDTADHVLDPHTAARDDLIGRFLFGRQLAAARLLGGHDHFHLVRRKGQEAQVLEQPASRW